MNPCFICGGLCCQVIKAPLIGGEIAEVLKLRSLHYDDSTCLLDCRCCQLTHEGRCAVYETKPQRCADFEVGGALCREIIARLKPDRAEEILRYLPTLPSQDPESNPPNQ